MAHKHAATDVAVVGTGLAALVVASRLMAAGKSVLILNPDWDFFAENSEIPLHPLWTQPAPLPKSTILRHSLDGAMQELRPIFPSTVESWNPVDPPPTRSLDFYDPTAPHLRSRTWVWVETTTGPATSTQKLDRVFLEASEAEMRPQIHEGFSALKRFPGFSGGTALWTSTAFQGVSVSRIVDVDANRYRNGFLEFIRHRLPAERIVCSASQLGLTDDGIRFYCEKGYQNHPITDGLVICLTPRVLQWLDQSLTRSMPRPVGFQTWEDWTVLSRSALDPEYVGVYKNMLVRAVFDGKPVGNQHQLGILRSGKMDHATDWGTNDSFADLSELCHKFLKWDRYAIRSMVPRTISQWSSRKIIQQERMIWIPGCDGPLVEIVHQVREIEEYFQ